MFKNFVNRINSEYGRIFVSILLGIGLACIFRKSCESRNCIVFRAPSFDEVHDSVYKYDNKCYTYKEDNVTCDESVKQVEIA